VNDNLELILLLMKSSKEKSKTAGKVKNTAKIKKDTSEKSPISHDDIRVKANEIFLQRIERGVYGTAENDWAEAEKFFRESEV